MRPWGSASKRPAPAITGEKFDPTRAVSTAAGTAIAARTSRMGGHAAGPPREPTTGLGRAAERFRSFDPGGVGARLENRLQGVGTRLGGGLPPEAPTAVRPPTTEERVGTRPQDETTGPRPPTEETTTPRAPADETAAPRPPADETTAPRPPTEEPGAGPGRKPLSAEAEAELAGPAKQMNEQDLKDTTNTRRKIGDAEHDFHMTKDGPEVCTGCNRTLGHVDNMLEGLPPGKLRSEVEGLRDLIQDVRKRMTEGESGVKMVADSAQITGKFKELLDNNPDLARRTGLTDPLETPSLHQTKGPTGAPETPAHLRDLGGTLVSTEKLSIQDYLTSGLRRKQDAIYILRDSSGAVLKVGVAQAARAASPST